MSAAQAREAAQQILQERRFHAPPVPRPLHGVLHALGAAIAPALRWVDHAVSAVAGVVPGGRAAVWAILGALLLGLAGLLATRSARMVLRDDPGPAGPGAPRGAPTAAALEREAQRAEREGRLEEAVRLRFRWGVASLSEREVIARAPSLPNAELSRILSSRRFDALARRFDEIVYGGRPAADDDARVAREGWGDVLREAGA